MARAGAVVFVSYSGIELLIDNPQFVSYQGILRTETIVNMMSMVRNSYVSPAVDSIRLENSGSVSLLSSGLNLVILLWKCCHECEGESR